MAEAEQSQAHSSTTHSSSHKSSDDSIRQSQVPGYLPASTAADMQMFPMMYPAFVPNLVPSQNQEHANRGAGVYAVPVLPFAGHIYGFPSNNLIPLTYNLPPPRPLNSGAEGEEHGQVGQQQQQQQPLHPAPQRQVVVRRFQIAIQLDLMLILKLAAVIFLFNHDGSKQKLTLLVFFASLVYLYQTGALAPLIRWLSQGMQRAAAPPQPPRPAVRAENVPAADRQGNEDAVLADGQEDNGNRPAEDGNRAVENENVAEPVAAAPVNPLWGIVKEIQMIVFGFITSLLPGFHNVE